MLRRSLASDGRTRAFINDEAVGVALLKDLGASLLEVHGQSDDRGLFDTSTHRGLLDAFGGSEALAEDVCARFAAYDARPRRPGGIAPHPGLAMADADYRARSRLTELSALDAQEGEEEAWRASAP